jgi:hypothetical protein
MEVILPEWTQFGLALLAFFLLALNHWLTRRAHDLCKRRSESEAPSPMR